MQSLIAFFTRLWSPSTTQAEQLGYAYVYDEQGTLLAEVGSGGTQSAGQAQYIYLPTANGPMPIAAVIDGATYAVHSDHLNTPRKLTNADGQAVWQWSYSAFGEDKLTLAKNRFANLEVTPNPGTTNISEVRFNLRYLGQYADGESGLFYNGFRTYDPRVSRYTQGDPIGLDGGWNRFGYVNGNPLSYSDPKGLQIAQIVRGGIGHGLGFCQADPNCRQKMQRAVQQCVDAAGRLKDWMWSDGGDSGDKHPSTPTGQRGSPIEVEPGTNEPTTIDGRDYTGHSLDRMQGRGLPPSVIEDAIQNGTSAPGNQPDTTVHVNPDGRVTVVTGGRGQVITVIPR